MEGALLVGAYQYRYASGMPGHRLGGQQLLGASSHNIIVPAYLNFDD